MAGRSLVGFALAAALGQVGLAGEPSPLPPGQRQLFLDDQAVAEVVNLTRTLHRPAKRGAVVKPDRPWEANLQTRCAPAWDDRAKRYKLWLLTSTPTAGVAGTTYAESPDGLRWEKPALRQWEYAGSRDNNFVAVDPKLAWPANAIENVVCDPADPDPRRRFKGFLGALGRRPIASPDGIAWAVLDAPALRSGDESNLSHDPRAKAFIATLKVDGPFGRAHGVWTSTDFRTWADTGGLIHADEEDQRLARAKIKARLADGRLRRPVYDAPAEYGADVYNVGVFRYEGLYVALPAVFYTTAVKPDNDGFHEVQLAASRDLKTWRRVGDRGAFLGPSAVGKDTYDHTELLPPSAPVVRGDELWFYYTGLKYRVPPKDADPDTGAVCLAVLRRDGFVSLDAGKEPGVVTTKPLAVAGANLWVNVEAPGGALEVTVLDAAGKAVAVSEPVAGDRPRAAVRWRTGGLAGQAGRPVSLRFTLRDGSFYSFWCDE